MEKFTAEAPDLLSRTSSYVLENDKLIPDELHIGEKALVYIHPDEYKIYTNFWLAFENCKICSTSNCSAGFKFDFIQDACSDQTQLSSFVSMPMSSSLQANEYIENINSEYNFQLVEINLFQFPHSSSCEFIISIVR